MRIISKGIQHFAAKFCDLSNLNTLLSAVVINFVLLAWIKKWSVAEIVHCLVSSGQNLANV